MHTYLFDDDVDVASNELRNGFSLGCLDWVVRLRVVTKVKSEAVRRSSPAADSSERPRLQHLRAHIQTNERTDQQTTNDASHTVLRHYSMTRKGAACLLCSLIHSHDTFTSDTKKSWDELVTSFHLLLHQEESHPIRLQRPAQLDVAKLSIEFCQWVQLAMFLRVTSQKYVLLPTCHMCILYMSKTLSAETRIRNTQDMYVPGKLLSLLPSLSRTPSAWR